MSLTAKILLGVFVITVIASVPIVSNVSKNLQAIPQATPIDISKLRSPDNSSASQESPIPQSTNNLYFIALADNGKKGKKIGCEDSLVSVKDTAIIQDSSLKSKYTRLFSIKEKTYEDTSLYNAIANSNLTFQKSEIKGDGTQVVYLVGSVSLGGTCDTPRVIEQLTQIAKDESPTKKAEIYLNGKTLQSALSQQ